MKRNFERTRDLLEKRYLAEELTGCQGGIHGFFIRRHNIDRSFANKKHVKADFSRCYDVITWCKDHRRQIHYDFLDKILAGIFKNRNLLNNFF